jgi:hypothetical protein
MVKERCWKCKKMRNDVELCADDRLCQPCFRRNEDELESARKRSNTTVATRSSCQADAIVRTTDSTTTRRVEEDTAEPLTSNETHREDITTGRSLSSPLIGHQITKIRWGDVDAAGMSSSIEGLTTSSTAHRECVDTGKKTVTERQAAIQLTGEVEIEPIPAVPKDDRSNNVACCTAVQCHCQIQIDYLNHQVAALQRQLNFVLSYVGITEHPDSATGDDGRFITASCPRDSDKKSDDIDSATNKPLFTEVLKYSAATVHHGVNQPGQRRQASLKESIVTAVYVDQSIKNSRASTVVVTGLQPSHATSDKSLFTNLCDMELGSKPSIVLTKRLGQSQPGRTQPLLVVLEDAKNAQQLIKSAKQLRSSTNAEVKAHVFINPNLTKAEAEAAFLIREHRRQRHRQNTSTVTDHRPDRQSPSINNQLVHTNETAPHSANAIVLPQLSALASD